MLSRVRDYWQEALAHGAVFHRPSLRRVDVDYKMGNNGSWPSMVGKAALHLDYVLWAAGTSGSDISQADFFRMLAPFVYVNGKDWHTHRSRVEVEVYQKEGLVKVKKELAFMRLASLAVQRAHYNLYCNKGTQDQRQAWKDLILAECPYSTVAREPQSRHRPPPVV